MTRAQLRRGRIRWLVTCVIAVLASAAPATARDNERMRPPLSVQQRLVRAGQFESGRVYRMLRPATVDAQFTTAGTGIVLRRAQSGVQTYVYLDLSDMREYPIQTEPRIAAILSQAMARAIADDALPLADLDYDPQRKIFGFTAFDRRWSIDAAGVARSFGGMASAAIAQPGETSPDGRYRAMAKGDNLVLVDTSDQHTIVLTGDGTPDRPYGRGIALLADKLAAHSDDVRGSTIAHWSPDGRYLLTYRLDLRGVRTLPVVEHAPRDTLYPRGYTVIYPMAGDPILPQVERIAIDVRAALTAGKGTPVRLAIPDETLLQPYLPGDYWTGARIRSVWTERGYAQQRVYSTDPASGTTQLLVDESVSPVVATTATAMFSAAPLAGEYVISERSGWAQLYLVTSDDPAGGRALTRGSWEVVSARPEPAAPGNLLIVGIGREADRSPYARQLYRVRSDGSAPQLLTPEALDHKTALSFDGHWILDSMSSPTHPTQLVLRAAADGHVVKVLGATDRTAIAPLHAVFPEPFEGLAADGTTKLSGMIFRPADYDPRRRYPVIDALYTGPTTHTVPTRWEDSVAASAHALAQIGAIVVMIDARGTSSRGQAFRLAAYRNMGEVGIDDHVAMLRQMAARYPSLDLDRLGVIGGSAGGYDAARFMLRRPGLFKVGVAASGNHELRLDKAWWPEESMGLADPDTWSRNSNISLAGQLRGKLLLVHGELDDNVPVANSMRLADAIYRFGGDVDLLIVPNAGHTVPWPLYWRKVYDYFLINLLHELPS